jgi:hypothetical protein
MEEDKLKTEGTESEVSTGSVAEPEKVMQPETVSATTEDAPAMATPPTESKPEEVETAAVAPAEESKIEPAVETVTPPEVSTDSESTTETVSIESTPSEVTVSESMDDKKGSKFSLKLVGLILAVVAALGFLSFGVYAYVQYNKPENQIKRAIGKSMTAESMQVKFDLDINQTGSEGVTQLLVGDISLSGEIMRNLSQSAAFLEINLPGADKAPRLEVRMFDDAIFFNLSNIGATLLSFTGNGELYQPLVNAFDGKWIRVGHDEITSVYPDFNAEQTELSDSDKSKIEQLIRDTDILSVQENLGDKDIEGVNATGYRVEVNPQELEQLIRDIGELELDAMTNTSKDEINKLADDFAAEAEKLGEQTARIEFWLADGYIRQLVVSGEDDTSKVTFTATTTKLNEDVSIELPEAQATLEDLQQALSALLFGALLDQQPSN